VTVVSLLISGVLLVVMIGIAVYGAVTLPADARIPIHYGIGAYANFASKAVGLVMWPAGGALIFGILTALAEHVITPNHGHHPQVSARRSCSRSSPPPNGARSRSREGTPIRRHNPARTGSRDQSLTPPLQVP
jgi:hypothetical protein